MNSSLWLIFRKNLEDLAALGLSFWWHKLLQLCKECLHQKEQVFQGHGLQFASLQYFPLLLGQVHLAPFSCLFHLVASLNL